MTASNQDAAKATTRTSMMRRFVSVLLGGACVLALATSADAQEIQLTGPLAGAPAVRHLRKYREGRFEIAPTISFSLLDEYRRAIMAGGRLQYNITEWLGIGAWGAYGVAEPTTDLTDQIDNPNTGALRKGGSPTTENINHANTDGTGYAPFANQVAKMQWVLAVPQVQLTPFRGKLSIFQKIFVDTDAYIHGGLGIVGLQERPDCGNSAGSTPCTDPKSFTLASRTAVTGTFGLGLNFYIADFLSLGVEYRALPFAWNRAGFDSRGAGPNNNFPDNKINSDDRTFKFNQMISIAIGFSLPSKPSISD
jgi:outer membrane beta-barrel protein